jgi:hypothetical protein
MDDATPSSSVPSGPALTFDGRRVVVAQAVVLATAPA